MADYELFERFSGGFSDYANRIRSIRKKYGIEANSDFNIFSSISEAYRYENMHSDIIKLILDPSTGKIGNSKNIELFCNLLDEINPGRKINLDKENISIEREKGKIDILIYDNDKNAIIIENKINDAKDQPDQLGRYYEYATKKRGLKVNVIVYLTLTPEKELDIKYSIKDDSQRESIKGLIIHLPVLNKEGGKDFINGFLESCIDNSIYCQEKDVARVYLSEYKELLQTLGGDFMTKDLDYDVLKEIWKDPQKIEVFNLFGSLWSRREGLLMDKIKELLDKEGFRVHDDDPWALYCKIDDVVSLGFHIREKCFGFVYTPNSKRLPAEQEYALKDLLSDKDLTDDIFLKKSDDSDDDDNDGFWVWKTVDMNKLSDCTCIVDNFRVLKELYKKMIKT